MTNYSLLFPGQGSQYVGMGKSFFESSIGEKLMAQAENLLAVPLRRFMLDGPKEDLTNTAIAQPAILLHSYAALLAFKEREPFAMTAVLGHSLGEYSALVAAEVLDFEDALLAVHTRGRLMQEAVPKGQGAMAAVLGLDAQIIKESLEELNDPLSPCYAACANFNGPGQTVIAGTKRGLEKASALLKLKGAKRIIELEVSAPFHCALMKPVQEQMAHVLDNIIFSDAKVPLISNVSAQPETKGARIKELLLSQISSPVRFSECVASLFELKLQGSLQIEFGPKNILSSMVKKISDSALCANIDGVDDLVKFEQSRIEQ